jgi:DNA invertase Pin-like site-specific DNA recombinase
MGRAVGHAPARAARADRPAVAGEGNEQIVAAGVAVTPGEALAEYPALQVRAQLLLDVRGEASVIVLTGVSHERLEVLAHQPVQYGLGRAPGCIGGREGGHRGRLGGSRAVLDPRKTPAACLSLLLSGRGCGAGVLVVARRDRIARDVVLAVEIERAASRLGARLVSATGEGNGDSPADAFLRTVIDGAAQYERGMIRARTRAALAAKRARRERVGAVPYGFALQDDGVHLLAAPHEQATIARARLLRAAGLSLRAVAAKLASEGRVSRRGRTFLPEQVARMVTAEARRRTLASSH